MINWHKMFLLPFCHLKDAVSNLVTSHAVANKVIHIQRGLTKCDTDD